MHRHIGAENELGQPVRGQPRAKVGRALFVEGAEGGGEAAPREPLASELVARAHRSGARHGWPGARWVMGGVGVAGGGRGGPRARARRAAAQGCFLAKK
jgi:hypothetical protein